MKLTWREINGSRAGIDGKGCRSEGGRLFQRTGAWIWKDLSVSLRREVIVGRRRVMISDDLVRDDDCFDNRLWRGCAV